MAGSDRNLIAERNNKWLGTASVRIDVLEFPNEVNKKNAARLTKLFEDGRIREDSPLHRIPAKISWSELEAALNLSGITIGDIRGTANRQQGSPRLELPHACKLKCHRGLHRTLAASQARSGSEPAARRWTVDLYLSGKKRTQVTL